jgi:hypothetical protein
MSKIDVDSLTLAKEARLIVVAQLNPGPVMLGALVDAIEKLVQERTILLEGARRAHAELNVIDDDFRVNGARNLLWNLITDAGK